jgi:hypothetical protein
VVFSAKVNKTAVRYQSLQKEEASVVFILTKFLKCFIQSTNSPEFMNPLSDIMAKSLQEHS